MLTYILDKLSRVTSRGDFIPEIDGLRFLAIAQVVMLHSHTFITEKAAPFLDSTYDYPLMRLVFGSGGSGVYLFFAISGFILSLPFAAHHLKGERKIKLKNYYWRRITRIEPPYIISLIILFIASIAIGKYTFAFLFPRLLASLGYVHNLVYHGWSRVNGVAWSLEIEVQFYLLAPLLAAVFMIKNKAVRRGLLFGAIFLMLILNYFLPTADLTLYNYLHYFLVGFILADLYITKDKVKMSSRSLNLLGFVFLASFFLYRPDSSVIHQTIYTMSILGFYYIVLNNAFWSKLFSIKILTVIGGMCYTIYLYHYPIISFFGNKLVALRFTDYFLPNFILQFMMIIALIIAISAAFFLFLEKPFMRRNWPAALRVWFKRKIAIKQPHPKSMTAGMEDQA